jgi:hypothetical protein
MIELAIFLVGGLFGMAVGVYVVKREPFCFGLCDEQEACIEKQPQ